MYYDGIIGDSDSTEECDHGTSVASIISAMTNNSFQFAGIAGGWGDGEGEWDEDDRGVSIVGCKSADYADCHLSLLCYLIDVIEVDIISISWRAADRCNALFDSTLTVAKDMGIFVCAAAGNNGQNNIVNPANCSGVFAVGASYNNGKVSFSSYGGGLKLVAPGGYDGDNFLVYSPSSDTMNGIEVPVNPNDSLYNCRFHGTSASAPMVAGTAGLLLSLEQDDGVSLTREDLREILCSTASKDAGEGAYNLNDKYGWKNIKMGYGELNAGRALEYGRKQEVQVSQGWQWISTFMDVWYIEDDKSIDLLFDEIKESIVVIYDEDDSLYTPNDEVYVCDIDPWNSLKGYKAYFTEAGTWGILGKRLIPKFTPIELDSGVNLVPYLPGESLDPFDAFESIIGNPGTLCLAQDDQGNFMAWVDTLSLWFCNMEDLEPGEAYSLTMNQEDDLTYPNVGINAVRSRSGVSNRYPSHFRFRRSDRSYSVLFLSINVEDVEPAEGDEIGVFTSDGLCIGASVITGEERVGLAVWRDDKYTEEIDGYRNDDVFYFRYYDESRNVEIGVDSLYIFAPNRDASGRSSNFAVHNLEIGSQVFIPSSFELSQNHPNPFNASTEISYSLPDQADVSIIIYNINGQYVTTILKASQGVGKHRIVWNTGTEKGVSLSSGTYFYSLEAVSKKGTTYKSTRQMTLLK